MGARLLKSWICQPLKKIDEIEYRQNIVEKLIDNDNSRTKISESLHQIFDIQRLATRLSSAVALPKDFLSLKNSLYMLPELYETTKECGLDIFDVIEDDIPLLEEFAEIIDRTIAEDASNIIKDGNIIKEGADENLDYLRNLLNNGTSWIENFEEQEREKTGIKNLKVGFNKVFGYYIEITNSYLSQVPPHYIRKQTHAYPTT